MTLLSRPVLLAALVRTQTLVIVRQLHPKGRIGRRLDSDNPQSSGSVRNNRANVHVRRGLQ